MLSEPVEIVPDLPTHPAPMKVPEPASPIRHEGAVVLADAAAEFRRRALESQESRKSPADAADSLPSPVRSPKRSLRKRTQTALLSRPAPSKRWRRTSRRRRWKGAADLGTMLREMSIDHITRTSPEIEEEDDSEQERPRRDDLEEEDEEDDLEEQEEEATRSSRPTIGPDGRGWPVRG